MTRRPVNVHDAYHAHIYFGPGTVEQARSLAHEAGERFKVAVGRVHERNVGPHPQWSVQIAFARSRFDELVPWLDEHRNGLDILVHGLTGDDIADHTAHAYWLGNEHTLDLTAL
ncbi:MAG TPA: DOPA 4,5-dioxygenase family protein [Ramlibacter sp.]|jgi:DOPA 4,5-dioxygenase